MALETLPSPPRKTLKKLVFLGIIPKLVGHPPPSLGTFWNKNVNFGQKSGVIKAKIWPPKFHMQFWNTGTPNPPLLRKYS